MNISGYLRDIGSANESDFELMKKNIGIYIAHLVYFSSYISTISTLAKFFNSSLKLVDLKQRLLNSNGTYEESYSSPSSPSLYNGSTPLRNEKVSFLCRIFIEFLFSLLVDQNANYPFHHLTIRIVEV